jgi:YesN/AraC family two-component response regulator
MIDRDESTVNDLIYSLETERQLMLVLQEGDFKAIEALSIHIINQNLKSNVPKSRIAQALYITSLRVIQDSKIEKDYESYFIFGDDVSDDEFQSRCVTNFLDLSSRLIEQRTEESADLSSEVIAFIEDNYDKDISLTDVADHFHFSMVYMSKLFKKIVGINFKEYLTSIRVERAKQLLIQGWKVQDVALKVGFNNADSFIRMFKRATDISPGKFQSMSKR